MPPWEGVSDLLGLGRGGGGEGREGALEIIAMVTPVKTVQGRPEGRGWGLVGICNISTQLKQVGPNTGLDVSHDLRTLLPSHQNLLFTAIVGKLLL